jgi:hypothetical protein
VKAHVEVAIWFLAQGGGLALAAVGLDVAALHVAHAGFSFRLRDVHIPPPPISVNKYGVFNRLSSEFRRRYGQRKGVLCKYAAVKGLRAVSRRSPEKQKARGCSLRAVRMFRVVIPTTEISVGKAAE